MSQMDNRTPMAQRGLYLGQKQIQDRVHGQITMEPLLLQVMDTPEFQRLDNIKQLGGCSYIYPSATHTRKEHSIGVCHLAGLMVEHLRRTQPNLGIDNADYLCVKWAGLVHDIGHGPFSHMFEEFVHREGEEAEWRSTSARTKADRDELLEAMRAIGPPFVMHRALFASKGWTTEWDAVRARLPAFAACDGPELYAQYCIAEKAGYSHEKMSRTLLCHLVKTKLDDLDGHFEHANGEHCTLHARHAHGTHTRTRTARARARHGHGVDTAWSLLTAQARSSSTSCCCSSTGWRTGSRGRPT